MRVGQHEERHREQIEEDLKAKVWLAVYGELARPLWEIRREIQYRTETYRGNDDLLKKLNALMAMVAVPKFPVPSDAPLP